MITRSSYWWLVVFVVVLLIFAYLIAATPRPPADAEPCPPMITTPPDSE